MLQDAKHQLPSLSCLEHGIHKSKSFISKNFGESISKRIRDLYTVSSESSFVSFSQQQK